MAQLTATAFEEPTDAAARVRREPLDPEPRGRRHLRKAWMALGIALVVALATFGALITFGNDRIGLYGFGAAGLVALVGAGQGVTAIVRSFEPGARMTGMHRLGAVVAVLGNLFMVLAGSLRALLSTAQFSRGRQLRSRGRVLLAPVEDGIGWVHAAVARRVQEVPGGVAARWRENGRTEHASVAAFARLTLDLMALGAPAALVADAQRDALDEIRHAELCFDLASAMDGTASGPGAFPEAARARTLPGNRTLALATLAVDSLVDGALNEGVSARIVARLARQVEDVGIRQVLVEIAADEGRHAAHGWDVVLYCVAEGGEPVLRALQGAAMALPDRMRPIGGGAARSGEWESWGIPGAALEAAEFRKARRDIQRRVSTLCS
jgi:hypothetical protein